jgi:cytochrome c5
MNAHRGIRRLAPICLALWIVVVWMAAGVEGTAMSPRVAGAVQASPAGDVEKGRVALTQVCQGCHGGGIMRMLEVRKKSADEWRETVYRMIGRGAQVFPDEIEPITAYLVATAGQGRPPATPAVPAAEGGRPRSAAASQEPREAEATAILARRCRLCHDLAKATTKPASDESWDAIIDRMVILGASVTPAEHQTLSEYLAGLKK